MSIAGRATWTALPAAAVLLVAEPALAQSLSLDLGGEDGSLTGTIVQLIALVTVLSLAPALLVMVTSFTRIVVVLSFLRSALGTQQAPPNQVIISLALFLTAYIMAPAFQQAWEDGLRPLIDQEIEIDQAFDPIVSPFRDFMLAHVREQDLGLFVEMGDLDPGAGPEEVPLQALVPAFMISELKRAFEIGFLLYLPFLIIDMVVASILMSMGMMMLPPVMISLPFKLVFFVLVDGWYLVTGSLMESFGTI